ncbi:MAG TPA: cellulose synthase [Trebonia sp.]|nr:cellulose synthase [Trebonia sp.]
MDYNSFVWLPVCAGLTALGLILSYVVGRRRGHLSMLRGAAWSLLPLAAYLTGSVEMFWKIGVAIGHYADGFVFSPVKWAGIGVAGVSALLFFSTGGRGRRKAARSARKTARADRRNAADGTGATAAVGAAGTTRAPGTLIPGDQDLAAARARTAPAKTAAQASPAKPAKPAKPGKGAGKTSPSADDDMKDIEEILRNRGI